MALPERYSRSYSSARIAPACGSRSMGGRSAISRPTGRSAYAPGASGRRRWSTPCDFTLEGRSVRKLRQSVHRVERRGWQIEVCEGRDIDRELEAEIDALEAAWRSERERLLGFAMSMGEFELAVRPRRPIRAGVVARRPAAGGDAIPGPSRQAVAGHDAPGGRDAQRTERGAGLPRAGVRAQSRRPRGEPQLRRARPPGSAGTRRATVSARRSPSSLLNRLRRSFQMDRLVLFNQKFFPSWRPRYLIYESRAALPRSAFRVLQAEGYLPRARHEVPSRARRAVAAPVLLAHRSRSGWADEKAGRHSRRSCSRPPASPCSGCPGPTATAATTTCTVASPRSCSCHAPAPGACWRSTSTRRRFTAGPTTWSTCRRATAPSRRYPVYYLLHGMPGQPKVFVDIANMDVRLDNQLASATRGR